MDRFLSHCAKYIYNKHADDLNDICLVFPNRRAGVFFYSYLQKFLSGPVITPYITQVNTLISDHSKLVFGEKLHLISILYNIFKNHVSTEESFDEFYFWGEVLLSDFNDIDLYLVNAKDIFTNISDIKEIESLFDYLTPEQKEALVRFWSSLGGSDRKKHNKRFVSLWHKLYPVYCDFKKVLKNIGIGYSGMIHREVVEEKGISQISFSYKKYYFIGLNALNNCEEAFFSYLQKQNKAEFLWDYSHYYLEDDSNEAGKFMRKNIRQFFPPSGFNINNNFFEKEKNIKLVAVSSNYGQAQEIPGFMNKIDHGNKDLFDNTAIILADESLLFPALSAIPENIETVNVTMGYPVKDSVVYGFLLLLVNIFRNRKADHENNVVIYHRFVTDILNHQLLSGIETEKVNEFIDNIKEKNRLTVPLYEIDFSEIHKLIFTLPGKVNDLSSYFIKILTTLYETVKYADPKNQLLTEVIYAIFQAMEKLEAVVVTAQKEQGIELSEAVYFRLFGQYLEQLSVAFEGEPLKGIQVMGILETRCLDFKNIIILGFNENKWPRKFTAPSFIPYSIRKGFGMPGIDEQDAMYAYYFYRLINRAENITATYSTLKEGINTGELSRYGYQLLYDSNFSVNMENLVFSFFSDPVPPVIVPKTSCVTDILLQNNTKNNPLSPTAINIFLQCSLRFYFRYILQLPEPDEVKDEIDSPLFGNIFHETVECLYKPFVGKQINKSDLEKIRNNKELIAGEILKAINKHYFKHSDHVNLEKPRGKTILIFENIKIFLKRLLDIDIRLAPFKLIALEKNYHTKLNINVNGKQKNIFLGGKIDRIDMINGTLRVLDYKTGNIESFAFEEVGQLFEKEIERPKKEIFQALLYCFILKENTGDEYPLKPVIYGLRELFKEKFSPEIKFNKENLYFQYIEAEFVNKLKILISEIFSSEYKFMQTPHEKICSYCPYNTICQRY